MLVHGGALRPIFTNEVRQSIHNSASVGLSVCFAFLIGFYFGQQGLAACAALFTCQTTLGARLKQGLGLVFLMIGGVFLGDVLAMVLPRLLCTGALVVFVLLGSRAWFVNVPLSRKAYFGSGAFLFMLFVSTWSPANSFVVLRAQTIDVALGGMVALMCRHALAPSRFDVAFSQGILPVFKLFKRKAAQWAACLGQAHDGMRPMQHDHGTLAKAFLPQTSHYPEWAYEVGFNPGLRAGVRSFLLNTEWLAELYICVDYLFVSQGERFASVWDKGGHGLVLPLQSVVRNNNKLLSVLIGHFEKNALYDPGTDFTSDMLVLKRKLQSYLPGNIELLDISLDFVLLSMLYQDLDDMRKALLQLAMAISK